MRTPQVFSTTFILSYFFPSQRLSAYHLSSSSSTSDHSQNIVSPVFYFTSIELGGWEFSPAMISIFFAVIGVSQALWQLVVFPPLQKRLGTVKVLKACMIGWPLLLGITPFTNWLLRMGWTRAFVSFFRLLSLEERASRL